jgi:hypothetical protein
MAAGGGVRLGRITIVCLVVGIASLFGVLGPRLIGDAEARARTLGAMRRKFAALHDFALFRSRGDKAVLRWGEGTPAHAKDKTETSPAHRRRSSLSASEN